ncbi:thioesterase domain-containing protein, partial [Williamsia sp.]|uniref:thioesterase domain-containing protein n=1 Tax=Williamsia sp. TaxID=1872085 RepID=UPI001A2E3ADB
DSVGGDPRTETEATVLAVFRHVLDNDTLGVDDDYFVAGGTSLQLAQVTAALQTRMGTRIPIAVIFSHPSPAGLAAAIDAGTDALAALAPVVELTDPARTPTAEPPLWTVHPASGLALAYRPLADTLAVPVVGLQLPGLLDSAAPMPATLADLAAVHIEALRRHQPHGPYRLAGWSVGGQLAHEMARQLAESGDVIELLALLDPRIGVDIGVDAFTAEGAGIDPEMAARLAAIDPVRYADYQRRAQMLVTAAAAHEPGVVDVRTAIYVAARDNTDPYRWDPMVVGPMSHEVLTVDHADIGDPAAMTVVAGMLALLLPPVRDREATDHQENR